ncbi:MAG: hypothetical protein H6742_14400 [Alphaproteobacteria bacterium]|nr:hypothetical protein [Alphaproteobacteria bacterium]
MLLPLLLQAALAAPPEPVPAPVVPTPAITLQDPQGYRKYAASLQRDALDAWRGTDAAEPYHFAAEVHAELAELVARWPGRVTPERVGTTVEGRPIWAFRVADPSAPVERSLLVMANIHALEWISTEVALAFLQEVAARPPRGVEIVVVPVLNPDGRAKVEADLLEGRRDVYRRGNAPQIDLNRDFAVHREARAIWKAIIPGRYAVSPGPLSQPESQAVDRLGQRGFDVAVSLHAFGGYHFLPWTGRTERPDDWGRLLALGTAMQAGQGAHAYKPMQLSRWAFFFRGHGMEIDHLYGTYGTLSVLTELTRSGIRGPGDFGDYFRWYNPARPARHVALGVGALRNVAWTQAWAVRTGEPEPWGAP